MSDGAVRGGPAASGQPSGGSPGVGGQSGGGRPGMGPGAGRGGGHGMGPMGGMGRPGEKPREFGRTFSRLLGYLRPHALRLAVVVVLAMISMAFSIVSPKIQGVVMDKLKDAFVARMTLDRVSRLQAELGPRLTRLTTGSGAVAAAAPPVAPPSQEYLSGARDFLSVPSLAAIHDKGQEADAVAALLASMKKMPGVAAFDSASSPPDMGKLSPSSLSPSSRPAGFTDAQLADSIRAIRATGGKVDFAAVGRILVFLLGLYLLSSLFLFVTQWMMSTVAQETVSRLRRAAQAKIDRLPLRYLDGRPHGDLLSRVTNDIDTISTTLQQSIVQSITSAIQLVGFVIMMLTISPFLTLIVLATLPLYVGATVLVAKNSQKFFVAQQREIGGLSGHIEEMYSGHAIVKAFGMERRSKDKFDAINGRLRSASTSAQFVSGIMYPLMNFIGNIGYVLISVVGGLWLTKGRLSIGDIVAFIQYSRSFAQPIAQTANIANIIQSTLACAERVFEVLDEAEEKGDEPGAVVPSGVQGHVSIAGLSFRYVQDRPLIEDLGLDARPGHTVAIVGPTGAGKTTLVNLLMRFYEIDGGAITIDGKDIRSLPRRGLRGLFGMVLQDTWLFTGTIRDNIAYGRDGASEDEVVAAARAAHADHFIRSLPQGYDTVLDEEAGNISQGQRQLLTIARAIIADPRILILDEATSSVDTRTELLIQKAMGNLMEGRTSFVIAHRLSTIRDAELILVMDRGSIVEQGTHEELLARKAFYADLYEAQFAGPVTE